MFSSSCKSLNYKQVQAKNKGYRIYVCEQDNTVCTSNRKGDRYRELKEERIEGLGGRDRVPQYFNCLGCNDSYQNLYNHCMMHYELLFVCNL